MKRRDFIQQMSSLLVLASCGKRVDTIDEILDKPIKLRFTVASDWHYGEPGTDYETYFTNFYDGYTAFNKQYPSEFFVFNGDIIHNNLSFLKPAADLLKSVHPNLYVTHGNHDRVTEELWESTWGMGFDHEFIVKDQVILLGGTSNIMGAELCPNVGWFKEKLEKHKGARNIFIFLHIHPGRLGCTEFTDLLANYSNISAVFNGHDHNAEGIDMIGKIPFMFDGRIGGSWGTFDRQFRVIELKEDNSLVTYLMTPLKKKKQTSFY